MCCFLACYVRVFKSARLIQDNNLVQGYEILGLSSKNPGSVLPEKDRKQ